MNSHFLTTAAHLMAASEVRKFRLEWAWRTRSGLHFFKTVWHGRDQKHALARFVSATPQAVNVRVMEEVLR